MRKIRISNNMDAKEVIASLDTPVKELFAENDITVGINCKINVGGYNCTEEEESWTLRDFIDNGYIDDNEDRVITVQTVKATKNAR